jgi:hypothetical protein
MPHRLRATVILLLTLGMYPSAAFAKEVINTFPNWDGQVTNGWSATAQTFIVPASSILQSYQFGIEPSNHGGDLDFSVHAWTIEGPVEPSLFTRTIPWPTHGDSLVVNDIDLALIPAQIYSVKIDFNGYSGPSVHFTQIPAYASGHAQWFNGTWNDYPELDHRFRATFVPEPSSMGLAAIGVSAWGLVRRARKPRAM